MHLRGDIARGLCCICQTPITRNYEIAVIHTLMEDEDTFSVAIFDATNMKTPLAICIYSRVIDDSIIINLLCKSKSCEIPRLGAMLLYLVCYSLRDSGIKKIELNKSNDNQALKLYKGIGFVIQPAPNTDTMVLDTSEINPFKMNGGRSKIMKF